MCPTAGSAIFLSCLLLYNPSISVKWEILEGDGQCRKVTNKQTDRQTGLNKQINQVLTAF